jgi:hypothetical protein
MSNFRVLGNENPTAELANAGLLGPRYIQGVVIPRAVGNHSVSGPDGNIKLPSQAMVSRIVMTGYDLASGGAATLQPNLAASAGATLGTSLGAVHSMADVSGRVCDIQVTPLNGVGAGDSWLNVNIATANLTAGTIDVLVEFF